MLRSILSSTTAPARQSASQVCLAFIRKHSACIHIHTHSFVRSYSFSFAFIVQSKFISSFAFTQSVCIHSRSHSFNIHSFDLLSFVDIQSAFIRIRIRIHSAYVFDCIALTHSCVRLHLFIQLPFIRVGIHSACIEQFEFIRRHSISTHSHSHSHSVSMY